MPSSILTTMNLQPISRISPSRYHSLLQCALREIWSSSRQAALLPASPAARLGSVSHKVLELASKGKIESVGELAGIWDRVVRNVEKEMENLNTERHLVPLQKHSYKYEVKRRLTFALTKDIMQAKRHKEIKTEKRSVESEQWLETSDGKIGGLIDLIVHRQDGAELLDYKTGEVLEAGDEESRLKQAYQIQLCLYATLYHEARGVWPVKLTLVTLDGMAHDVRFDRDCCLRLVRAVRENLDKINDMIKDGAEPGQFASPSPEACHFCTYRPACKKYWKTRNDDENWPLDVSGELVQKKMLGNGSLRIVVDTGGRTVAIRGLSPERHEFLNEDVKKVLFCNLVRDSAKDFYIEAPLTFGYGVE